MSTPVTKGTTPSRTSCRAPEPRKRAANSNRQVLAPHRQVDDCPSIWQVVEAFDFFRKPGALDGGQKSTRFFVELGPQLRFAHRILGRAAIVLLDSDKRLTACQVDADLAFESTRAREVRAQRDI